MEVVADVDVPEGEAVFLGVVLEVGGEGEIGGGLVGGVEAEDAEAGVFLHAADGPGKVVAAGLVVAAPADPLVLGVEDPDAIEVGIEEGRKELRLGVASLEDVLEAEAETGVAVGGGEAVGAVTVAPLIFLVEAVEGVGTVVGAVLGTGDPSEVEVRNEGVAGGLVVTPDAGLEGGADLEEGAEEGVAVGGVRVVGAAPAETGGEGETLGEGDGTAEDVAGVDAEGVVVGPVAEAVGVTGVPGAVVLRGLAVKPTGGVLGAGRGRMSRRASGRRRTPA